jgi:transcriptional regulatory protein RtcR
MTDRCANGASASCTTRSPPTSRRSRPRPTVERRDVGLRDPWDFEEVFDKLYQLSAGARVRPGGEDLLVHMTTGTHVAQICLFLLTETRHFPARCCRPGRRRRTRKVPGTWQIIDLDLSRFDRLAQRFAQEHRKASRC